MVEDALVVMVTCPADKAPVLAAALVEERVAACVNVVPGLLSVYRWKGAVQQDPETLLLAKTTVGRFDALKALVLRHHPHELPEVIALKVDRGHVPYLDWIQESTR
ncbi:MAG TPA: divalent-cation tolerance protein CutA [Verrucomicrobiae bacterium]|nr:divalent-cation tolerance protein CutA [Verrucomicrobiae bacterium]